MSTITVPILMRGDDHEQVKVGNAQYNTVRETITFRVDVDAAGGHYLLGKAIELGLLESFIIQPQASEMGVKATEELEDEPATDVFDV